MTRHFALRLTVVGVFVLGCAVFVIFYCLNTGTQVPGVNVGDYETSFSSKDVAGLVDNAEVRIAGIVVGRISNLERSGPSGAAEVRLVLNKNVAPLHQGATVRVGMKSLIGSYFVDVVDGKGPPLPSGTHLPDQNVLPTVEVQDVLRELDPPTRQALTQTVRSLGRATQGRGEDLGTLVDGLGKLGRNGDTALDAIAAQSQDLQALTHETTDLLNTLDTGSGQIVDVVDQAQTVTRSTAGQQDALAQTMRQMPGVLGSADSATQSLTTLSGALAPVASDLNKAAPDLNKALLQLPDTSRNLRGLLPTLNGTLDRAPATLQRVPNLADDVKALIPPTHELLRDANPALAYAAPYGRDIGAMIANFGSTLQTNVENGVNAARLSVSMGSQAVRASPIHDEQLDPTNWNNPFPMPGEAANTPPFTGPYPHVERAPG